VIVSPQHHPARLRAREELLWISFGAMVFRYEIKRFNGGSGRGRQGLGLQPFRV